MHSFCILINEYIQLCLNVRSNLLECTESVIKLYIYRIPNFTKTSYVLFGLANNIRCSFVQETLILLTLNTIYLKYGNS